VPVATYLAIMLWRSPFVIRRLLQRVVKRNITVHIPWLLVTGSVLLYAWRLRRKQVSCHASVQTSFQTKAEARSDGRKENEGKRRFLQKVVVITGAAGDIGNATASAFAREGASIVLVDLPQTLPQLEDQCKELQASGAYKTVVLCADMTREEEVQSMVAKTVERLGPINCFFNNAGIQGELAPIHHQNSKLAQRVIQSQGEG
jgi:FlaA1/EpsC-like NDP-sugar epimerase